MEAIAAAAAFAQISELIYKCMKKTKAAIERFRKIHANFQHFANTAADFRHLLTMTSSTINDMRLCKLPALHEPSVMCLMKSIVKTCNITGASIREISRNLRRSTTKHSSPSKIPQWILRIVYSYELREIEKELSRLEPVKTDILLFVSLMTLQSRLERWKQYQVQGLQIPQDLARSV